MSTTAPATPRAPVPAPPPGTVPALWLALLATPVAAGANAPVLILPDMARSLSVGTTTATWLVTAFAWAMAVGTPVMGGLLRHHGARPTLRLSTLLATVGTVLVVTAPWLPLALLGRAAQAAGGAGFITVAMSLAGSARRMGVITAGFGMFGAVGPLLGSWTGGALSWRVALAVSAVALLALPAVLRHLPETAGAERTAGVRRRGTAAGDPEGPERFDTRGAALLVALVTALVLVPQSPGWALAGAALPGLLLAVHVRRHRDGFVPAALLRAPAFLGSALLACALSTSYFALLFAVPRLLDDRTGWSSGVIGTGQLLALLAGSALSWLLAAASTRMRRGAVLAVLVTLGALAPLTAALSSWGPLLLVVAAAAVFAATGGNATLSVRAAQAAPTSQRPAAIGLFVLCYQLGGAFGPGIAALVALG